MLTSYKVTDKVRLKAMPGIGSESEYTGVVKEVTYEEEVPIYVVRIDPGFELPFNTVEVSEDNILGINNPTLH